MEKNALLPLLLIGQHGFRNGQLVGQAGTCNELGNSTGDIHRVWRETKRSVRDEESGQSPWGPPAQWFSHAGGAPACLLGCYLN